MRIYTRTCACAFITFFFGLYFLYCVLFWRIYLIFFCLRNTSHTIQKIYFVLIFVKSGKMMPHSLIFMCEEPKVRRAKSIFCHSHQKPFAGNSYAVFYNYTKSAYNLPPPSDPQRHPKAARILQKSIKIATFLQTLLCKIRKKCTFLKKNCSKICTYQKKAVPLHRQTEKTTLKNIRDMKTIYENGCAQLDGRKVLKFWNRPTIEVARELKNMLLEDGVPCKVVKNEKAGYCKVVSLNGTYVYATFVGAEEA